tara:strand:- start:490 stop:915 length:426 start_codon:yes stop_codon:yes gene_type:complete
MKTFIKSTLLAASLAVAGVAATAPSASAASTGFSIVIGGGQPVQVTHKYKHQNGHGWDKGNNRDRRGWNKDHDNRGGWNKKQYGNICAPGQALKKARSMGIRNARIVDADRRTVKVRGVRNGFRSGAVFANDRGCPLIARR